MIDGILPDLARATWACEPRALEAFLRSAAAAGDRRADVPSKGAALGRGGAAAIVPVRGVLVRGRGDGFLRSLGLANTGYDEIREQVDEALADSSVKRIVLDIDSPGGDAHGLDALYHHLSVAAESKPITACIAGQGCSAAFFVAVAATEIVAERDALVGSIGAYAVVTDMSEIAGKAGIKVHVIRSGPYKGMGTPGDQITEAQLAMAQQVIDDLAAGFVHAVAEGRDMSLEAARDLATGATWVAKRAKGMGLIDSIGTLADIIAGSAGRSTKMSTDRDGARAEEAEKEKDEERSESDEEGEGEDDEEERSESDEDEDEDEEPEDKNKAASLEQLEKAFAGRAAFVLRCLKGGYSIPRARREALELELAETKARLQQAEAAAKAGVDPRRLAPTLTGFQRSAAAAETFIEAAAAYKLEQKCSMAAALRAIAKARPELYEQHVHEARVAAGARPVKAWGSSEPVRSR